jgi:hypothetical protein
MRYERRRRRAPVSGQAYACSPCRMARGWVGDASFANKAHTSPPGITRSTASASHATGGSVALETATSNAERPASISPLPRSNVTSARPTAPRTVRKKLTRLPSGSTSVTARSSRIKASGSPGAPAPVPTSTTRAPRGRRAASTRASANIKSTISSGDRAAVRSIRAFHSSRRSSHVSIARRAVAGRVNASSPATRATRSSRLAGIGCKWYLCVGLAASPAAWPCPPSARSPSVTST